MEGPGEGDKKEKEGMCKMIPTEHFREDTDTYFTSCSILVFQDIQQIRTQMAENDTDNQ